MKNRFFIPCLLLLLLSSFTILSCQREGITFGMDYSTSFTIPSTVGINLAVDLPTPDVTTNAEGEFEGHDTKSKYVKSISLESLDLEITSPSGKTFSFLKSVYIYINSEGMSETLLASMDPVPTPAASSLSLIVTNNDFAAYVKQEKFTLRTQVVTDETILQNVDIDADLKFDVAATANL